MLWNLPVDPVLFAGCILSFGLANLHEIRYRNFEETCMLVGSVVVCFERKKFLLPNRATARFCTLPSSAWIPPWTLGMRTGPRH
jgi:hypothetical protein